MTRGIIRNDWSSVTVPDLDGWRPALTVSVVIPAFEHQDTLDLTLAALRYQTYPADLLEVVVVDDGGDPALRLPRIRPERTALLRAEGGWGKAHALRFGVANSSGDILHLLDSDMIVFPEHVAAHARWHHALRYAVTLGRKRFIDRPRPWPDPETVARACEAGEAADLFGGEAGEPHDYQERYIAQTDQLRLADHLAFRAYVGATVAMRRELYEAAGGPDPRLRFGNDTEFGYRLDQAGAVFVPEPRARSWHLGPTHVMLAEQEVARHRQAFIADLVPVPRRWREVGGTAWTVPLVEVSVAAGDEPLERVRAAVDSVLRSSERDTRVRLVGPWDRLETGRVPALTDPQLDLRLIAATYRGDPRVRLVKRAPDSAFPSPYLLEMSAAYGLAPHALAHLVDLAEGHRAGVVRVTAPDGAGDAPAALLWRTAARGRAGWIRRAGEPMLEAVAAVHGRWDVSAEDAGIVDLTRFEPAELVGGIGGLEAPGPRRGRGGRMLPSTVEVGGVRSLARAAVVVAWHGARRVRAALRRGPGRRSRG